MNAKCLLDTNIFVYAFHPDAPAKARIANDLIRAAVASGQGVISYQVIQEFFSVALRKFPQPIPAAESGVILAEVFRPLLAIESSMWLFRQALDLTRDHRLPWCDALIVAAAQEAECGILYSEDFQHGRRFGGVLVQNPFAGV
ncbi:MAG TPA: PIN domain-containing protein [Terriglobales bacterium]